MEAGRDYVAEAESGWDFNPRFNGYCTQFNPVDLNSLLYRYETLLASFTEKLNKGAMVWKMRALARVKRMRVMEDPETGVMYDYNYVTNCRSEVISAASFWPYWVGIKMEPTGIDILLEALELPYGITVTVPTAGNYQWGYGKAWAPLADVVIMALDSLGLKEDAMRVAHKYVDLIANCFAKTGALWEKYDAMTGEVVEACEYETPQMMGWTAGAYLSALTYITENEK